MQKWQQWESASDADWDLAVEREAVIRPLAAQKRLCTDDVEEAARHLGVVRSVLYKLMRRYRQRPQTSSLLPFKRERDTHTTVLDQPRELLLDSFDWKSHCCRLASCAFATSASSPTGTVLRCFHCAFDCSADHSKTQLRRHHHPQNRLIHSGTAQSAAVPSASLNGTPLPNSCFAPHLNQNGASHEPLSTSSAFARASARTRMPCLIRSKTLRCQPLQRPNQASKSH